MPSARGRSLGFTRNANPPHTYTHACLCLRVSKGHIKGAYLKKLSDTNLSVRAKDEIFFFFGLPKIFLTDLLVEEEVILSVVRS